MVWIDIVILTIIGVSVIISIVRGFVKEAMSLIVWIAAFWISLTFAARLSVELQRWIADQTAQRIAAYALLFVATLIVGALVNYVINQLVKKTGLSGTDRMIGMFFGLGRGIIIVSVLLLLANYTSIPQDPVWKESKMISHIQPAVKALVNVLPDEMKDYFKTSNEGQDLDLQKMQEVLKKKDQLLQNIASDKKTDSK